MAGQGSESKTLGYATGSIRIRQDNGTVDNKPSSDDESIRSRSGLAFELGLH